MKKYSKIQKFKQPEQISFLFRVFSKVKFKKKPFVDEF